MKNNMDFVPNTKSISLLQENGEYNGWVEKTTSVWWLDEEVKNSFTFYNLDTFYNDDYFMNDHVKDEVVNNYVNHVSFFFKKITGKNLNSVLEMGTAGGWFTKKFQDKGYDIFGLEGSSCGIEATLAKGVKQENLLKHDFRLPINLDKKFDIVCCTEVAEHLEIPFAGTLIKTLVDHSDIVWFSSAPPYVLQMPSSYHHPNEQPDIFWINLFDFFNYDYVKLSDEIYNDTNLRGRYIFYNRNVYNIEEKLFEKEMSTQETEFEIYKQKQIDSESFESTFDKYAGGQIFSLDTFLTSVAKKDDMILDAGCGDGTGLKFLFNSGYKNLYGIDINPNKYFLAKNHIGDDRVIDSDITNTPFEDEKFDIVWCSHTLEHSYSPIESLKELCRITKKGGYVLIIIPYPTPHSDVHCGVNELKLNIQDNAESCINTLKENGFNIQEYYRMNIREPELFLKIKI